MGVSIYGPHTKLINLVIHDAGVGVGCWTPAEEAEVYGTVIYHNGWQGPTPDRGHGHGIYGQNAVGTKRMVDNIIFNQYGYGIHNYTQGGELKGFWIEGNILFGNGSAAQPSTGDEPNLLVGGYKAAERVRVVSNYSYHALAKQGTTNVQLSYTAKNNKDLVVKENYFAGGSLVSLVQEWEQAQVTGNTFVGGQDLVAALLPEGVGASAYQWENNTYISVNKSPAATPFIFRSQGQGQNYTFAAWQQATGFDKSSKYFKSGTGRPTGVKIAVRPNQYEAGRANIVVYNWDLKDTVEVEVNNVLRVGAKYEVRNVLNYFGIPVAAGIYDGRPLRLPMKGTDTGPEFNAFVLLAPAP